jgi:hypothetical protein
MVLFMADVLAPHFLVQRLLLEANYTFLSPTTETVHTTFCLYNTKLPIKYSITSHHHGTNCSRQQYGPDQHQS